MTEQDLKTYLAQLDSYAKYALDIERNMDEENERFLTLCKSAILVYEGSLNIQVKVNEDIISAKEALKRGETLKIHR